MGQHQRRRISRYSTFSAENRSHVRTGTKGDVFKDTQERDAVKVSLDDLSCDSFTITIGCDAERVETYGRPFYELSANRVDFAAKPELDGTHFMTQNCPTRRTLHTLEKEDQSAALFQCPRFLVDCAVQAGIV